MIQSLLCSTFMVHSVRCTKKTSRDHENPSEEDYLNVLRMEPGMPPRVAWLPKCSCQKMDNVVGFSIPWRARTAANRCWIHLRRVGVSICVFIRVNCKSLILLQHLGCEQWSRNVGLTCFMEMQHMYIYIHKYLKALLLYLVRFRGQNIQDSHVKWTFSHE